MIGLAVNTLSQSLSWILSYILSWILLYSVQLFLNTSPSHLSRLPI